jgi:hypothetical protein
VPSYVWIALTVFVAGLVLGTVWLTANGLRFWRRGLPAAKRITASSNMLTKRTAELERRLTRLEPKIAELQRDSNRLALALARARVQLGVVLEAKTMVDRLRFFIP